MTNEDKTPSHRATNRALVRYVVLPTCLLTVALLGGVRVNFETRAFQFIAPPLITLFLAALTFTLLMRGRAIIINRWLSSAHAPLSNIAHALMLTVLFFATAQSFNTVLPERGLFRFLLAFFFLWTLWNNLFSSFDARRVLRSLTALFGMAFIIKHLLLANLYSSNDGGWMKRLAGAVFENITTSLFENERFAPATGYIAFFTLLLYLCGLVLLSFSFNEETPEDLMTDRTPPNESPKRLTN
ncbi:MAG: hypothetical protein NVSMB56_14130 [Pyrinomonadaceae bacterium]